MISLISKQGEGGIISIPSYACPGLFPEPTAAISMLSLISKQGEGGIISTPLRPGRYRISRRPFPAPGQNLEDRC